LHKIKLVTIALLFNAAVCLAAQAEDDLPAVDGFSGEFELLDRDGELVRDDAFRGKNVLLAFGFTHCVHVCPMIAANMARALKETDKDAAGIFISVDTERDTPTITADYAQRFGAMMIGLSGSYEQVSLAAKSFNATFVVTKSPNSYTVQHTPAIYLISPEGDLIDVFAMNTPPAKIAAAME
jgi:protein SCO1/2